jgi:hypothetical protein
LGKSDHAVQLAGVIGLAMAVELAYVKVAPARLG